MQKERGVIVSDPFRPIYSFWPKEKYNNRVEELLDYRKRRISTGIASNGLLSAKDIIKYLVYWDKIDYPNNNILGSDLKGDDGLELLHEQGILTRTFHFLEGGLFNMEMMLDVQLSAFEYLNQQSPGQWTLAQNLNDLYLPAKDTEIKRVVEFNLYNNLPVPVDTTPIHEILDFKDRRKDELLQLRIHLDNIYNDIISAEKIQQEYQKRVEEISKDLYDLNRLFKEHKIKTRIDSLKSYFHNPKETISDILLPTSIIPLITSNIPTLAPYMPSVGMQLAAGAIIAFTSKKMRTPVHNTPLTEISPFAYTFQMGKEFQTR